MNGNCHEVDEVTMLRSLLTEALEWVTDKPWDDDTRLHQRISKALGLPVRYPDYVNNEGERK